MDRRRLFSVLCLALVARCHALIPIIGWSNSDAFSSVNGNEFSNADNFLYEASLEDVKMVIVFDSPELSFDSLAKRGGMYGGKNLGLGSIQLEVKNSKSSIWAGASGSVASSLVSTLTFILDTEPLTITDATDFTLHSLVVVKLPASTEEDGFSLQDQVISEVMSAVHSLPESPSYAAVYTSSHTHRPHPQHQELRRKRMAEVNRINNSIPDTDLNGEVTKCSSILSSNSSGHPCIVFCFSSTNISRSFFYNNNSGDEYSTHNVMENLTNVEFLDGSCSNDSDLCRDYGGPCISVYAKVEVNNTGNGTNNNVDVDNNVNFIFAFRKGYCIDQFGGSSSLPCGYWTMDLYITDSYVNGEKYRRGREERNIFTDFIVPIGTSYACGYDRLNVFNLTTEGVNGTVLDNVTGFAYHFTAIQVQAFSTVSLTKDGVPVFSSAYNCQGYLSTVTLMGLVGSAVLLIALFCSVLFVYGIQSPDRFDDPRGPTISVENLH